MPNTIINRKLVQGYNSGNPIPPGPPANDVYFFMLWGQSNNTARYTISGNLPAPQQAVLTDVYNWAYNSGTPGWQPYQSGSQDSYGDDFVINGSTAIYSNQPGMFAIANTLAYTLVNTYGKKVYCVNASVGGTGLDPSFTPHTWDSGTASNLYDFALNMSIDAFVACKADNPSATIKPVLLWIQGETDAATSSTTAGNYQTNLTNIINTARTDLGGADPDLVDVSWIVTSLRADTVYTYKNPVQLSQVAVCSSLTDVYLHYMNTTRTPISADGNHYTPISASYVGQLGAINAGLDLAEATQLLYETFTPTGYIMALGGEIITDGDYNYRDFVTHGILKVVDTGSKNIDNYLVVGGGGSGGFGDGASAGGGGGGRVVPGTNFTTSVGDYTVLIGNGGVASVSADGIGFNGEQSSFDSIIAIGGGGGGGRDAEINGLNGGNGGGAGSFDSGGSGTGGTGDFNGGNGGPFPTGAGGGAGAGQNGQTGTALASGNGGNGYTWIDTITYGGGGGASGTAVTQGAGGTGGGGDGQLRNPAGIPAVQGTDGLGGGGGGNSADGDPGPKVPGGKGRVKLRIKFQN